MQTWRRRACRHDAKTLGDRMRQVLDFIVVPRAGLEPALLAEPDFESHRTIKHLRALQADHVCIGFAD